MTLCRTCEVDVLLHGVIPPLSVVHKDLQSYQRGYLSAACPGEEAGRGVMEGMTHCLVCSPDTSSCYQPERHEEKHSGAGRREKR